MSLYRIMLVDDEEEVRKAMIRKMDWEGLGFTVVGDAENGQDALEKLEQLPGCVEHPRQMGPAVQKPWGCAELHEIADCRSHRQDLSGPGGCCLSFRLGHRPQRFGLYCGTCSAASLSSSSL